MSLPDFKTARQQLTGGMPTGSYDMAGMEFTVWRKLPMDWIVQQLQEWPVEREDRSNVYLTSLDDALAWLDKQP